MPTRPQNHGVRMSVLTIAMSDLSFGDLLALLF